MSYIMSCCYGPPSACVEYYYLRSHHHGSWDMSRSNWIVNEYTNNIWGRKVYLCYLQTLLWVTQVQPLSKNKGKKERKPYLLIILPGVTARLGTCSKDIIPTCVNMSLLLFSKKLIVCKIRIRILLLISGMFFVESKFLLILFDATRKEPLPCRIKRDQ